MGEVENCAGTEESEVQVPINAENEDQAMANTVSEANVPKLKEATLTLDEESTAKPARNLSDEEYEKIFAAVLKCYSPSKTDTEAKEDDFETIIKDDEHMASHYVEAFVSHSEDRGNKEGEQANDGEKKGGKSEEDGNDDNNEDEEAAAHDESVQIDGEAIQELGDDVASEDLQAINENTPELEPEKSVAPKIPRKKKRSFRQKEDSTAPKSIKLEDKTKDWHVKLKEKKVHRPGNQKSSNVTQVSGGSQGKSQTLSSKQKMQQRRFLETGTWVQCEKKYCMKWRYLEDVHDPSSLPDKWTCDLLSGCSCESPEEEWDESVHCEQFVFTKFTEGSLVWARMPGYPWWPGMVEIDPDFKTFFECAGSNQQIATAYHVVFLDEKVSRAWINMKFLKPFDGEKRMGPTVLKGHNYYKAIEKSSHMAKEAMEMNLEGRLQNFGFAKRFKGKWRSDLADNEVLDAGPSTSGLKSKKVKKRNQTSATKSLHSPSLSHKSTADTLIKTLGMERTEVEYYLENAEEIIKGAEDVLEEFLSSQSHRSQYTEESDYEEERPKVKKQKFTSKQGKIPTSSSKQVPNVIKTKEAMNESVENKNLEIQTEKSSKGKAPKKGIKGLKKGKTSNTALKPDLIKSTAEKKVALTEKTNSTESKIIEVKENEVPTEKKLTNENNKEQMTSKRKVESVKDSKGKAQTEPVTEKKKPSFPTFSGKKKAPQFGIPMKKQKIEPEASLKTEVKNIALGKEEKMSETPEKQNISEASEEAENASSKVPMAFDPDVFTMDTSETQKEQGEDEILKKKENIEEKKAVDEYNLEKTEESFKSDSGTDKNGDVPEIVKDAESDIQKTANGEVKESDNVMETDELPKKEEITSATEDNDNDKDNSDFEFED